MATKPDLSTKNTNTWCPGCPNNMILAATKQAITNQIESGENKQGDFAMTTGIGCHAKIFDLLNISGIYCLHGRTIPTAIGMKLGNPNLKVLSFAGDGDTYAEGMAHFIHAFRYNIDMTLIVHDNQSFSLTTGQPTPTSQQGYVSKAKPQGETFKPFNPLKQALATFIARTSARDIPHMTETIQAAINHKGFAFVEVIQDCLIFNLDANAKDKMMYKTEPNTDKTTADKLASEFDYNSKEGKIPIGIIYQENDSPKK